MLPNLNPITAPDAYCTDCSKKMEIEVEKGPNGRLQHIWYICRNPESGCRYKIAHDQRLNGMAQRIKE